MRNDNAMYGIIEGPVDEERARRLLSDWCAWNPSEGILVINYLNYYVEECGGRLVDVYDAEDVRDVTEKVIRDERGDYLELYVFKGITPEVVGGILSTEDFRGRDDMTWMGSMDYRSTSEHEQEATVGGLVGELARDPASWVCCRVPGERPEGTSPAESIEEALAATSAGKLAVARLKEGAERNIAEQARGGRRRP